MWKVSCVNPDCSYQDKYKQWREIPGICPYCHSDLKLEKEREVSDEKKRSYQER